MRVAVGDAAEQRQLHRRLIEFAGLQAELRTVAGSALAAPEVDFVSGAEVGVKVIDGLVIAVGIELAVAVAAQ
ncbi:hypothetical protein D3C84_958100 [compost metagenome]